MSYDQDDEVRIAPKRTPAEPVVSRDLEVIVTLMELGAIVLSPEYSATFTKEELFRETREFGGAEIILLDGDMDIVLGMGGIVQRVPGGRYRMKPIGRYIG